MFNKSPRVQKKVLKLVSQLEGSIRSTGPGSTYILPYMDQSDPGSAHIFSYVDQRRYIADFSMVLWLKNASCL